MEVVERSGAEVFVMENVPQLLGSPEHEEIIEAAESRGFMLASAKLLAADYGVPQLRWRAFILGCRFADPAIVFPPKKTHYNPNNGLRSASPDGNGHRLERWRTVRDVIEDLPKPIGSAIRKKSPPLDLHPDP